MTSALGFNLGDDRLRDDSAVNFRVEGKPLPRDRIPSNPGIVAMRKIDWGGAGQIPEAVKPGPLWQFSFHKSVFFRYVVARRAGNHCAKCGSLKGTLGVGVSGLFYGRPKDR